MNWQTYLMHGRANGNAWRAGCPYQKMFPCQCHPNHKTFAAIDHQLRKPRVLKWGRERSILIFNIEERSLDLIKRIWITQHDKQH
jgi:hypothetical protein